MSVTPIENPAVADRALPDPSPAHRHTALAALTHGQGLLGLLLVVAVAIAGLPAHWIAPFGPNEQIAGANLLGPGPEHWALSASLCRSRV